MFKRDPFRCSLGFHSWEGEGEKKCCKFCDKNYTPRKCRLGYYSKHTWEINQKSGVKRCKFCGIFYEHWKDEWSGNDTDGA